MKKNIVTLGLFTILAIFPLISWFYLRTGADYRRGLLKETRPMGDVATFYNCDTTGFGKRATLINFGDIDQSIINKIDKQFKDGKGYTLVNSNSSCIIENDTIKQNIKMMLVDTARQLRVVYDNYEDATIKSLVEHLTIVIPPDEVRDIKMK